MQVNQETYWKSKYGYSLDTWVIPGSDLLKYAGQSIIKLTFTKTEDKKDWKSEFNPVEVKSIGNFNGLLGTYDLTLSNEEKYTVYPNGFSFGDPEIVDELYRFIPWSLHHKNIETAKFYDNLLAKYQSSSTLSLDGLKTLSSADSIPENMYITAVLKLNSEDKVLDLKLKSIRLRHIQKEKYQLTLNTEKEDTLILDIKTTDQSYNVTLKGQDLGYIKVFDLAL